MDTALIEEIGKIVGQYAFPIITSCALFWYIVVESRANRKTISELQQAISELKKCIENNNKISESFVDLVKEWRRLG